MSDKSPSNFSIDVPIFDKDKFISWTALNDTIMGGASNASCKVTSEGLFLEGDLVESGGGFVSCRSPVSKDPLDLSSFKGLRLQVDGQGRTLKLAVACKNRRFGLIDFLDTGLRWVASIPTKNSGITVADILFSSLEPTIRAKPFPFPVRFNSSSIIQFQLLHSKFGQPGKLNPGFRPGKICINLRSISAIS